MEKLIRDRIKADHWEPKRKILIVGTPHSTLAGIMNFAVPSHKVTLIDHLKPERNGDYLVGPIKWNFKFINGKRVPDYRYLFKGRIKRSKCTKLKFNGR